MKTLRVATLNIWNHSGPWAERLALIREDLDRLSPDVIGLQEVLRLTKEGEPPDATWDAPAVLPPDASVDQASAIGAGFDFRIAYARAADFGSELAFGNALLSRYPILGVASFRLPGEESGETRCLLFAMLEHPEGRLPVFVTHLNPKFHHGSVRIRQVCFIAERIKQLVPLETTLPPILMGDLNAEPDSDEIRFLKGLATIDGKSVYFADSWLYAGDGSPGYTYDRKNRFAALAHEAPRRIDYIFVRGPDRRFRGEPLKTELAFAKSRPGAEGDVWPSDHFGLITELSM